MNLVKVLPYKIAYQMRKWISKRHYRLPDRNSAFKYHYQIGLGFQISSEQELGSQISLLNRNWAIKYHYWTAIWLPNIITRHEFDFQISLPDGGLALKYPNENFSLLSGNDVWGPNSFPVMPLWEPNLCSVMPFWEVIASCIVYHASCNMHHASEPKKTTSKIIRPQK